MSQLSEYLVCAVMIGTGATAVMDAWGIAGSWLFGLRPANYGLVGRWFAHMAHGRFHHESIAAAPPMPGERLMGWTAHYLTGIVFAALLLAIAGLDWARHPTIAPALIFGFASVLAPFLVMQPGMGLGLASGRTPDPAAARIRSLITHGVFGIGLYAAAWAASKLRLVLA
jgi:hypothetical protein